jgi:hypothetical protein
MSYGPIELESLTVRYSPGVGQFLRNEMTRLTKTKGRQYSLNDVIREMIEAFRAMFGLPPAGLRGPRKGPAEAADGHASIRLAPPL